MDFPHNCVHTMEQALNAELKGSPIEKARGWLEQSEGVLFKRMLGMESELFPRGIYLNILYTQLKMWKDSEVAKKWYQNEAPLHDDILTRIVQQRRSYVPSSKSMSTNLGSHYINLAYTQKESPTIFMEKGRPDK